jgi:outer membrane lipoprotein-sorting protein
VSVPLGIGTRPFARTHAVERTSWIFTRAAASALFVFGLAVTGTPARSAEPAHVKASALDPFLSRLTTNGRATVSIERHAVQVTGDLAVRGALALEPPDRVRIDFDTTGEKVALRADGGEWLQPALRQCVRLGPERARVALEWWDLFMTPKREGFIERRSAGGRVMIVRAGAGAPADTAWVTLTDGNPTALEISQEGGGRSTYEFRHWKFSHAHGRGAFVLAAPHGWESVDLP